VQTKLVPVLIRSAALSPKRAGARIVQIGAAQLGLAADDRRYSQVDGLVRGPRAVTVVEIAGPAALPAAR
jgi:hypothetical protein